MKKHGISRHLPSTMWKSRKPQLFPVILLVAILLPGVSQGSLITADISVFLDDGMKAPGSTNTGQPFGSSPSFDTTWDILPSAQSGLTTLGAAVMEVRMLTFNVNADGRNATQAGGNGLGVLTGDDNNYMDARTGETALFQLSFFKDLGKTDSINVHSITLDSLIVRSANVSNPAINAYAGSGAITKGGTNGIRHSIGGTVLRTSNDAANSFVSDLNLSPATTPGTNYYTVNSTGVIFGQDDSLWLRRTGNTNEYEFQLAAVNLSVAVVPEPSAFLGLLGLICGGSFVRRRRKLA